MATMTSYATERHVHEPLHGIRQRIPLLLRANSCRRELQRFKYRKKKMMRTTQIWKAAFWDRRKGTKLKGGSR